MTMSRAVPTRSTAPPMVGTVRTARIMRVLRARAAPLPTLQLILQPREALVLAEHGEHVEDSGRGGASGQRRAHGLGDRSELDLLALGERAHRGFRRLYAPRLDALKVADRLAEQGPCVAGQQCLGLVVERDRP